MKPQSAIFLPCSNYLVGISAYCPANLYVFRYIEAALTKLELRHERLPLTETFPELDLSDTSFLTSFNEKLDHFPVKVGTK